LSSMINAYRDVSADTSKVNTLVQFDLPKDKKTWRFKIDSNGKVNAGSLDEEMGINPAAELVRSMDWVVKCYPAKKYGIILMDHGSGAEDYRGVYLQDASYKKSCIGLENIFITNKSLNEFKKGNAKSRKFDKKKHSNVSGNLSENKRGILYDDSDGTCLSSQGLKTALEQIRDNVLGRKLNFIGMDACLMAMVEVAYQMKDTVDVFVGSEEVELAPGWPYDLLLSEVLKRPSFYNTLELGILAVNVYAERHNRRCTQSAINMNMINVLRDNINLVATTLLECMKYRYSSVRSALRAARENSFEFKHEDYIDLYTFYDALHIEITRLRQESESETPTCCGLFKPSVNYRLALDRLVQYLIDGKGIIGQIVFANVTSRDSRDAHGLSICFPKRLIDIHGSYPRTQFIQDVPSWYSLIKKV
jgi:hypothetical protein